MTIAEQVAQKLHAVSDPREDRPRDLIDIYLCGTRIPLDNAELREICVRTFTERGEHAWPPIIEMRAEWQGRLAALIADSELELTVDEVMEGVRSLVAELAAPILG
jgi:hypothetical protein